MPGPPASESTHLQGDPAAFVRLGGWLFRHRTLLPLPIAAALILISSPSSSPSSSLPIPWVGLASVGLGEALRLWAVRHIGVISRTRSDRLGPLVSTGPFGLVRNPLYVGNIAIWTGFALGARILWLAPLIALIMAVEYHAIAKWEERLLESRLGDDYRTYAARVPRWVPHRHKSQGSSDLSRDTNSKMDAAGPRFSWGETFFSERGTLIALAIGYGLLWVKSEFHGWL
jgi:protein-S-isoprenylcysteine O-methyltransferase Ste14